VIWSNAQHEIDWAQSLASSVDVQDGGATFAVTLRPYSWSDDVPVTADDVLYWWSQVQQLGETYVYYGTGGVPKLIRDVTVTGPHTLVVHLTQAVNPDWFEQSGLGQFYALPRHVWGRLSLTQQQNEQSSASFYKVSDGPFLLSQLVLGRYAAFVPNPTYGGHRATIRRLVVDFLQGSDPLAALEAGQVDMATLPFTVWDAARHLPGFRAVSIGPIAGYFTIIPNLKSTHATFLADVRVRQAISMAINQKQIIDVVFHGSSLPDRGFVPTALSHYLSPEIKDGTSPLTDDPGRARALLDAAGWRLGADGVRAKDGTRMEFDVLVTAGVAERMEMLQLVAADLAAVGIVVHVREAQFNQVIARMLGPANGWDAVLIGWSMPGYPEGSQFFATGSTSNYEHYSNPEMDRLLKAAVDKPGLDGLFAVENLALQQQPMIYLPDGFHEVLVRPGIAGVRDAIKPNGMWLPEYLTLSGAMACH
jgi:peptide/nickel transport system substrate-binding protein